MGGLRSVLVWGRIRVGWVFWKRRFLVKFWKSWGWLGEVGVGGRFYRKREFFLFLFRVFISISRLVCYCVDLLLKNFFGFCWLCG